METQKAIKQLQAGKAPGSDGIPPEIYKEGGDAVQVKLNELLQQFWEESSVLQDFKDANIIHLYKNKGDRASCDNHRGISLLNVAGKIMARVILNRITQYLLDDVVSESQCGFRRNRGTIDMIFAVRQIQEKCREQNQNLYILFVDLTKAFDTVSRGGLWAILSKLGCPERFVSIIRSFHKGMMARVIEHGAASYPFPVYNDVKQGCVLAPTLFSLLFATMLFAALSKTSSGIYVHYRCDGRFFDLRRLKAKDQSPWSSCTWLPFRRRLCPCSSERTRSARTRQLPVRSSQSFWTDHQPAENWGDAPTHAWPHPSSRA